MSEKISVIVPIYNASLYLEKCIQSVRNQSYKNLEILLINDGSTDESGEVCHQFIHDERIVYFERENHGVSATRNFGIEKSTGDFIMFIDADDFLQEDAVTVLYENLKKTNVDVAIGSHIPTFDKDYTFKETKNELQIWDNEAALKEFLVTTKTSFFTFAKLFKKEVIGNIRFNEKLTLAEDALFITEVYLNSTFKTVYTTKEIYAYIQHKNSLTTVVDEYHVFDTIRAHAKVYKMIYTRYPHLKEVLVERKYWAYFTVLDKIILSKNKKLTTQKNKIKKNIKSNLWKILRIKGFNLSRKIAVCILIFSEKLYIQCVKYKNRNI